MGSTENTRKIGNISNIGEIRTNFEFIEMEGGERNFARICDIGEVGNIGKTRIIWNKGKIGEILNIRKILKM